MLHSTRVSWSKNKENIGSRSPTAEETEQSWSLGPAWTRVSNSLELLSHFLSPLSLSSITLCSRGRGYSFEQIWASLYTGLEAEKKGWVLVSFGWKVRKRDHDWPAFDHMSIRPEDAHVPRLPALLCQVCTALWMRPSLATPSIIILLTSPPPKSVFPLFLLWFSHSIYQHLIYNLLTCWVYCLALLTMI